MNRAIFDHLDSVFPAPKGQVIGEAGGNGRNGFVNGAQGATGMSICSLETGYRRLIRVRDGLLFNVFWRTCTGRNGFSIDRYV